PHPVSAITRLVFSRCLFMILRAPRSPLFPYTTLFRSVADWRDAFHPGVPGLRACANAGLVGRGALRTGAGWLRRYRGDSRRGARSEEHTSELQSRENLVCRLLLEKKKRRRAVTWKRRR